MASQQDGILRSGVDPNFLHANSTAHTWIFGAFAELIDNAYDPDVNASELWIDKLDYGETSCLRFLDNGAGMDKNKLHKMLSFGYCDKRTVEPTGSHKPIGHYGNGFKSGSMRIGKDALVFTRTKDSASIGFLSQTYLKAIKAESVIVPMVDYSLPNLERDQSQETKNNLEAILRHSLFRSEEQLKDELRALGKFETGTKIIISNLAQLPDGQLELDFSSDQTDILCPEAHEADKSAVKNKPVALYPSKYKLFLREYCTILFLKPRMIIHIRGKKVRSKLVSTCLNSPEYLNYHPRNEKKSIRVTFGFTWEHDTSEDYGMMLYHRNRLIKAFERVGYQKQSNNAYGIGVVGVAEVDFLEPIHTKQDFIRNTIFNNAIKWFGDKLNDYWNDKKTSRTPSNTRSQRGGRTESRDPATNLTPPEREINLGILDNAQYPVNQNQTQQSDVSPISIKPNKPNPQSKRKYTAESARSENGKKICPESRESPVITPVREEEDNIASTSGAPPEGNQIIPRETFGNDFSNPPNIENFDFTNNDHSPEIKTTSSTGGISMVSADAAGATNNQTDFLVQRTKEPTSTVHAQREMSATQMIEELKTKMNELKTEIDKSNSEEVEMSATQMIEELKTKMNELKTEIDQSNSEEVDMSATQKNEPDELKKEINELQTKIAKLHSEKDEMGATQNRLIEEINELKTLMFKFLSLSYDENDLGDVNDIGQRVKDFIKN